MTGTPGARHVPAMSPNLFRRILRLDARGAKSVWRMATPDVGLVRGNLLIRDNNNDHKARRLLILLGTGALRKDRKRLIGLAPVHLCLST